MTNYICVQFGNSDTSDQWYNVSTTHSTAPSAERYGLDTMCIAGQFGFVVVELRNEDEWDLLEHRSMLTPKDWWVGSYKGQVVVKKLPALV